MKKKILPSLFNKMDGKQGEDVEADEEKKDCEVKSSDGEVKKVFTQFFGESKKILF